MKQLPKDIEVKIEFLRSEHGGRKMAAFCGYQSQFFYNGSDWDAVHDYIGTETVEPGMRVKAHLPFMSPHEHEGNIYLSMPFLVREGNRVVGFGSVTKIIELPQSAARIRERTKGVRLDSRDQSIHHIFSLE